MQERVDKLFSRLGLCSRSEVHGLIRAGKITINNTPVLSMREKVDPTKILFKGSSLEHPHGIKILFNKPKGVLCTRLGEDSIFSYFPDNWVNRRPVVNSAGRLDKYTTGMLIVTDDGDLVHRIISPKNHIAKIYDLEVEVPFDGSEVYLFKSGTIILPDEKKPCQPALLEVHSDRTGRITLFEGKHHQVKKMVEKANNRVLKLHRSGIGKLMLGGLKSGDWRDLTTEDLQLIGI